MTTIRNKGQALVEYLFLIVFLIILGSRLVGNLTDFMRTSVGNLGHVMSINLATGICSQNCFFKGYLNEPPGGP